MLVDHPASVGYRSVGEAGAISRGSTAAGRRCRRGASTISLAARLRERLRRGRPTTRRGHRDLVLRGKHVSVAYAGRRAEGVRAGLGSDAISTTPTSRWIFRTPRLPASNRSILFGPGGRVCGTSISPMEQAQSRMSISCQAAVTSAPGGYCSTSRSGILPGTSSWRSIRARAAPAHSGKPTSPSRWPLRGYTWQRPSIPHTPWTPPGLPARSEARARR